MNRPLREHFEVPTDAGEALRTFDYIEELEKYIDHLEALRQPDVSGNEVALPQMVIAWLGRWRDKLPIEAIHSLQNICGNDR